MSDSVPSLAGFGTAESRWARLGPYYAMFPIEFTRRVVATYSKHGDTLIDPFCGRGTAPYVAMISGRQAVGCDVNPVAWMYAATKTGPHPSVDNVTQRLAQIQSAIRSDDRKPSNEFQKMAFSARSLGFINASRRELRWREERLDRTVAAFMIHFLHAKLGQGLSNQMRASRALAPAYSIRWWKSRGMDIPPDIDPVAFLDVRVQWRYAKGLPAYAGEPTILWCDAAKGLSVKAATFEKADLILTSPPYSGVTNYRLDSWLRLWALGEGPELPSWSADQKFCNSERYTTMLTEAFTSTNAQSKPDAIWYIRVDARPRTRDIVRQLMAEILVEHLRYEQSAPYQRTTQTALYGDRGRKPGELDLLYIPRSRVKPAFLRGFTRAA